MPFNKKADNEVGKLRTFRLSDRINDLIVSQHGSLAAWNRKYEQINEQLKKLGK